ncbi:MAG: type I glyceraldehyde-3-phosphate dehydrogenase [Planctomycetes bacterium]|jgi:glyceraldehyde 3-phosphate dehydrogenase|nr:type I glyceraldehyde-3-phosphate dehydrogenase [Planctomycetota bacterium]HJO26939.1 type I glyceraldehyde-3-phosphate dehydrogenase [Planctomycetota bacterium]
MRIAINGFGRIGRNVFRILSQRRDCEVVFINDLTDAATLAHLLKYDTVHGRFNGRVTAMKSAIKVNGKKVEILSERDPANLPHAQHKIDFVVEATGVFSTKAACSKHLTAGAKKVLLTVPPKDEIDAMIVLGVNDKALRPSHKIISNASCTTNCLAPLVKVLDAKFGLVNGLMTTVHAYTNDQRILDLPHGDLRRARSAAANIIPTTTGAARAVGKILPKLAGKLDGCAMRVPVPDGSVVDLVANLKRRVTVEEVNAAFAAAAKKDLKGVLEYTEDPIVSSDIVGNPHSSIFDAKCTMVMAGKQVKVISWYDNEWGYSNRVVELMRLAHSLKPKRRAKGPARKKTAKRAK